MLRTQLLHPQILYALGAAGHGAQVLISDSNYPYSTGAPPSAQRVYLNLAPGLISLTDVLRVIAGAIPVEAAYGIVPDDGIEPAIFVEYRQLLPGLPLHKLTRFPFYEQAKSSDTVLVIATGEQRTFACIILTIGVVSPAE